MKKLYCLTVLFLLALPLMAAHVEPETAQKVATNFLNNNGAKATQLTDLSKEAGFANLYIFNANQGFVVMAAEDCVQPILGYSLTGHFDAKDMPTNVSGWLQGYNDEIQYAIESQTRATAETAQLWKDLAEGNSKAGRATVVVEPLIQTKWNQNKYYNYLCPAVSDGPDGHAYTGCVATAMAQIMKYWGYPAHGLGSHSYTWNGQTLSANFEATDYDWNQMAPYYEYYYENGTDQYAIGLPEPSEEELTAIATLMYHCGVSVNMNYGGSSTGGSSAANNAVATALKDYFNYKSTVEYKQKSYNNQTYYSDSQWIAMVKEELDQQRPLQYAGQDPNGAGGHAFVCDGYDDANYFHFNWGWAGNYNGYFSLSNLNTGANSSQAGAGNGNYTRNQSAVFGIEPATNLAAPTNLTYTLNGLQNLTLSWDGVNAAASYNVYRNGSLVGNTTTPTYTEIAPFGTNIYFVRCVDANGQQSLASNSVTVTINYPTPIVDDLTATLSGNNVNLSWTAPEWCYPETPTATLTYGDESPYGTVGTGSATPYYWGNRHLANDLTDFNGKVLYKVSFYANDPGNYECFIFKGSGSYSNYYYPNEEIAHFVTTTSKTGWADIDFDETIDIDSSQDLWVFIYDPVGRPYPASYSIFSGHTNGGYCTSQYPITTVSHYLVGTYSNAAWLIKAYVTDGTYTYNLYQDGTQIAQDLNQTSYNATLNNNAANLFSVKTNYYGGETAASNMIGFAKGNASLAALSLSTNDMMTVTEGSSLSVTGDCSNNGGDLVIENDGQFKYNNAAGNEIQATVKKTIAGHGGDNGTNGYYFLANPVMESLAIADMESLTTGNYDLYYFDQDQEKEWINHKQTDNNFTHLVNGTGYLYANSANQTLSFSGTIRPTNMDVTQGLDYYEGNPFAGFNLIGNPYTCNAYINKPDFYVIGEGAQGGEVMAATSDVIAPTQGLFVIADGPGDEVVFTTEPSGTTGKSIDIRLDNREGRSLDVARVRFGEGTGLRKMQLKSNHTKVYIPQGDKDYAVVVAENQIDALPVCFQAETNGQYTLSFNTEEMEMDYLHLIDNMTGNDIDLLATPTYTFQARTTDYASRFKLVFMASEGADDATDLPFAFVSDGQLIVHGEGTLQVFDALGRQIFNKELSVFRSPFSVFHSPGVYVLRLTNNHETKTQKIIIE